MKFPKTIIQRTKENIFVFSFGTILILISIYSFFSHNCITLSIGENISRAVGSFIIVIGFQSIFWALGIRLEILGTNINNIDDNSPDIETDNKNNNWETNYYTFPEMLFKFEESLLIAENSFTIRRNNEKEIRNAFDITRQNFELLNFSGDVMILHISAHLERMILIQSQNTKEEQFAINPARAIRYLEESGKVTKEMVHVFESFWKIRNSVVHSSLKIPDKKQIIAVFDLGTRLTFLFLAMNISSDGGGQNKNSYN